MRGRTIITLGVLTIILMVILVSLPLLFRHSPSGLLEVVEVDESLQEGMYAVTVMAVEDGVDLSECVLDIDGRAFRYPGLSGAWPVSGPEDLSVYKVKVENVSGPITPEESEIPDIDGDSVPETAYLCTEDNDCPSTFASRYVAFNLSSSSSLSYVALTGPDDNPVDLSKGEKVINTIAYSRDSLVGLIASGKTGVPYVLGLNGEKIRILGPMKESIYDLNGDQEKDLIGYADGNIFIRLSSKAGGKDKLLAGEKGILRFSRDADIVSGGDTVAHLAFADGTASLSVLQRHFAAEPIVLSDEMSFPVLNRGDVVRLLVPAQISKSRNKGSAKVKAEIGCSLHGREE